MDILKIRSFLGVSQQKLANLLGVSWITVQRWEHGQEPNSTSLLKLRGLMRLAHKISIIDPKKGGMLEIRMYVFPKEHLPMHFHIYVEDKGEKYLIDTDKFEFGVLKGYQEKIVRSWFNAHKNEVLANWQKCLEGSRPLPIQGDF